MHEVLENEKLVVGKLLNKDKEAFSLVFRTYFHELTVFASKYLELEEEAQEVVQDVFVKFWDKCHELDPESSIKNYLYRSVRNSCLNIIKHEKVKEGYRSFMMNHLEQEEMQASEEYDQARIRAALHKEIDALPPRCAEIFKLSRFEGLKYLEIADHLGISVKTVEVQMGKALQTLREKLAYLKRV